jgi:transglutaminase-like putative cysteine protease
MNSQMLQYLQPTPTIDCDHPEVIRFAEQHMSDCVGAREKAIKLYYAVRDKIRYDPYSFNPSIEGFRASITLNTGRAWCVPKAILLAACCRAIEIPARLGFADVRNHLMTARMRKTMNDEVFRWHGYTSMYLNGVWLKATPAFNIELCERFRLKPLDFDGRSDSIYHPFDLEGNRHMEYVRYRGEFADLPFDQITETFKSEYSSSESWSEADFDRDVE